MNAPHPALDYSEVLLINLGKFFEDALKLSSYQAVNAAVATIRVAVAKLKKPVTSVQEILIAARASGHMAQISNFYRSLPNEMAQDESVFYAPPCMPSTQDLLDILQGEATKPFLEKRSSEPGYPHVPVYALTPYGVDAFTHAMNAGMSVYHLLETVQNEVLTEHRGKHIQIFMDIKNSHFQQELWKTTQLLKFNDGHYYLKFPT